jgi:hypothetical protein
MGEGLDMQSIDDQKTEAEQSKDPFESSINTKKF